MKTFTDKTGDRWTIDVNVASIRRVKADTGVDLTKLTDPDSDAMAKLSDMYVLFDTLASLLSKQLQERGIDSEDLASRLDEGSLEEAASALIESVIDFFHPDRAKLIRKGYDKAKTILTRKRREAEAVAQLAIESDDFEANLLRELTSGS